MRATTFEQIEAELDAGHLEMVRPWGDWVPVRRRAATINGGGNYRIIPVYMEGFVEASITNASAQLGYPDVRIAE